MLIGNTKKIVSNAIFILIVALMIYPPSKIWIIRQISFAPSVEKEEDRTGLDTYQWRLRGLNTENLNFESLRGKVVFVNFWATWCAPCRAEMPMIQDLYNDYKDKIEFVFVTNESWTLVEKFYSKYNYDLPSYNSLDTPPKKFSETNSIPASYLIDKNGKVIISKIGPADWNSLKIRKLLDGLL
jgi:thiol-disulfide isomerase/thioredoxin